MTISITDEEWDGLTPENFDTTTLLRAVDAVGELRGDLNNGETIACRNCAPTC